MMGNYEAWGERFAQAKESLSGKGNALEIKKGAPSFVGLAHQIAAAAASSGCLTALAWPDVYIMAMEHMGA